MHLQLEWDVNSIRTLFQYTGNSKGKKSLPETCSGERYNNLLDSLVTNPIQAVLSSFSTLLKLSTV